MQEKIKNIINQFLNSKNFNPTKLYLILANIVLVVFAIWFSNVGVLPFKNVGDFAFFMALALVLALYRPSWTFAFFVGAIVLENINLAPISLGINFRPYQFFGFITIISLIVQYFSKRLVFSLPKFHWVDALPIVFAIGGFFSALGAAYKGASFKQAVIAVSFVVLYFLVRVYVQSFEDLKRIAPFFLSSSVVVMFYGIWQNVRFSYGANSFEVMPGRPNATFTEADWLGIFLVFLLAIEYSILVNSEQRTVNNKNALKITALWSLVTVTFITLILTVSRSAWIGAVIVVLGYLKITLLYSKNGVLQGSKNNFWREILGTIKQKWCWREFFQAIGGLILVLVLSFGVIYIFNLTSFQIGNRAVSTGGLQKITIACQGGSDNTVPEKISSVDELANYGCKHINLEDIEKEKTAGNIVTEVYRPDPNVGIRARIYLQSWQEIKSNPIFGIGWGSIGDILGKDERGAGLNASNIFLETYLGAGLLGILSLLILLGYIFVASCKKFVRAHGDDIAMIFILLGLFAIIIPNLFNSGIFLGFVWVFFGISTSLLQDK